MDKYYKKLPVRPILWGNWMTPLSLVGFALFLLPVLAAMILKIDMNNVAIWLGWLGILLAFIGLFIVAYDQKWATYRARKAGLRWGLDKKINKWTRI